MWATMDESFEKPENRLDVVRTGGPSEAEYVARSYEALTEYLLTQPRTR